MPDERWKECDNCQNQVPYPRSLCPVCEVDPDRDVNTEAVNQ